MKNNKRAKTKAQKSIRNRNVLREPSPLFETNRTELNDFSNIEINLSAEFPITSKYIAMDVNGTQYTANYSFTENTGLKLRSKYFYLNGKRLVENMRKHSKASFDWLMNRQEYMKFDDQEFVVRTFRFGDINSQYVLTDEVVETIRLVLMKQGSDDELSKLNSYSLEWDTKDAHLSNSIPKSRFKELLSEFSVNQSSITIIPDAASYYQYEKSFRETLCPVTLVNCDGKLVMSSVNAIFYIFQSVACGRTWATQKENPHVQNFKKTFHRVMDEYLELNDGLHVALEKVESDILMLKECIKINKLDETVLDYFAEKYAYSDEMPMSLHVKMLKTLGLKVPSWKPGISVIPVQAARFVYFIPTVTLFCEPEMIKLKLKLVDGIGTKILYYFMEEHVVRVKRAMIREAGKYGNGIEVDEVTGNHTMNKECNEQVSASIKSSETAVVHEETGTPSDGTDSSSDSAYHPENGLKAAEKVAKTSEPPSEPPLSQNPTSTLPPAISTACNSSCQTDPPLSSCFTCSKNITLRSEAQTEAKTAKNTLKKFEYNAKQAESRANQLKIKEKEVKKLESTVEEKDAEIRRLKEELQKKNEKVEVLEKIIKEKGEIIEKEQQETTDAKGANAFLRRRVEELQLKFAVEQSKVDEMIEKCKKVQQNPTVNRSRVINNDKPSTSEPSTSQLPPRAVLHKWQKLKDDLNRNTLLDEQKDMIENLIERTSDLHVQRFAEYELVRFEGTRSIYLQTIEMNIAKIKKTDDTASLLPLPEYPKLSNTFLDYYQKELENQPKPIVPGFDPNDECYMCLGEFSVDNQKVFGWKCVHPACYKCVEKWKKTQLESMNMKETTCGLCRKIEEEEKLKKTKNKKK